jgi:hypothetical protein
LSPTTVIAGAANDTAAMPRAARHTLQEARVSIVVAPADTGTAAVDLVMMMGC